MGEVIYIVFRNMCELEFGIHSHGVRYVKEDEGASYSGHHVMSSALKKGETHTYTWVANERSGNDSFNFFDS